LEVFSTQDCIGVELFQIVPCRFTFLSHWDLYGSRCPVAVIALLARHCRRDGNIVEPDLADEVVIVIRPPQAEPVAMGQRFHQTAATDQIVISGEVDGIIRGHVMESS
jgi:hypothetical protein